jgi:hypothetical protein
MRATTPRTASASADEMWYTRGSGSSRESGACAGRAWRADRPAHLPGAPVGRAVEAGAMGHHDHRDPRRGLRARRRRQTAAGGAIRQPEVVAAPAAPRHPGGPLHGGADHANSTAGAGRCGRGGCAPRSRTRPPRGPRIWCSGGFVRPGRTSCAWRTSPTHRGQLPDLELGIAAVPASRTASGRPKTPVWPNLPLHGFDQNRIWCAIVQLACELTTWTQMWRLAPTGTGSPPPAPTPRCGYGTPTPANPSATPQRPHRQGRECGV